MKRSFSTINKNKRDKSARSSQSHEALKRVLAFCLCALFVLSAVPVGLHFASADDNLTDASTTLNAVDPETTTAASDDTTAVDEDTTEPTSVDESATEPATQDADVEDGSAEGTTAADSNGALKAPAQAPAAKIDLVENSSALSNADVYVRINGTDQADSFSLNPGLISSAVAAQDSAIKAQYGMTNASTGFRKALLVSGSVETEISRVGTYNGVTYYSLHDYDDTGVALKDGEKIVLVYETIYNVTTHIIGLDGTGTQTINPGGSVTVESSVYKDDDLLIQTVPDSDNLYRLESITYTSGSKSGTLTASNNSATLTHDNYDGDIILTVTFKIPETFKINNVTPERTDEYNSGNAKTKGHGDLIANRFGPMTVPEAKAVMNDAATKDLSTSDAQSNVYDYAALDHTDDNPKSGTYYYYKEHDGVTVTEPLYWLINYYDDNKTYYDASQVLPEGVSPHGTTTFWLQSEKDTAFELNKLEVNGTLLNIPSGVGQTATTTVDGMTFYVYFESTGTYGSYWLKGDADFGSGQSDWSWTHFTTFWNSVSWSHTRTYYRITVENVTEDINVNYSFKRTEERELTILGLNGIDRTGMSTEDRSLTGYFYYYATTNDYHKYNAYYRDSTTTSNNLVLYSVKPGYNPYTVTTEMSYDGGAKSSDGIRVAGSEASTPENAIYSAGGRYNTGHRSWGRSTILKNKEAQKDKKNLLLTSLQDDETYNTTTWYAIALEQNKANNWMLYLNASPYEYHVEYDLDGGKITSKDKLTDNFVLSDDGTQLEDKTIKTVESQYAYFNMPLATPEKQNYIFEGWVLERRTTASTTVYQEYPNGKYYTLNSSGDGHDQEFDTEEEAKAYVEAALKNTYTAQSWKYVGTSREYYEGSQTTEKEEDGNDKTVTVDHSIVYTLTFAQEVTEKTYSPNEVFSITDNNYANLAYVSGDPKTNEDMYFTFVAKYLSVDASQNTEVDYKVYVQVPKGTESTDANPVIQKENGNYYQLDYHTVERQLIGDTVVLNQYAPKNPEYYAYNETYSRVQTTTTKLDADGNIPENNELYLYYDYQYQILTLDEDTRGEYANYLKDFDITITLSKDDLSPIDVPAAGTKVSYGDIEFTSDGTKLSATLKMSKATSQKKMVIPYGWNYTVEGADEDGYTLTYENGAGDTGENIGSLKSDRTVLVVYTKTDITPTGVLESTVFQASVLGAVILIGGTVVGIKVFRRKRNND